MSTRIGICRSRSTARRGFAIWFPTRTILAGAVEKFAAGGEWANRGCGDVPYADANYRSLGLADMAHAIRGARDRTAPTEIWRFMSLKLWKASVSPRRRAP